MTQASSTNPVVTLKDGRVVATSKDVATYFGKLHKDVIKAIDTLLGEAPSIERSFAPIELDVKVGFGTRKDRAFEMTRDGFTLLAMGFTGKKALQFNIFSGGIRESPRLFSISNLDMKVLVAEFTLILINFPTFHMNKDQT